MIETPGHAPSHVCLHQPEQRLLISGDHLLGRVSQYFDVGYTPDPVGEFLHSLDVVDGLDARLALAGHAPPVHRRPGPHRGQPASSSPSASTPSAPRSRGGPRTAYEVARAIYGERFTRGYGELADDAHARLARPPAAARRGRNDARSRSSTGRSSPRLRAMRIDERIASGVGTGLLVRVLPAQDGRGRGEPGGRAERARAAGPDVRLGHLRRRRHARRSAARRSTSSRASRPTTAWRRWRTSPASARPSTSCAPTLDRMRDAGIENVLALRGDPPAGVDANEWVAADGGLRYSRELIELIRADYDFAVGAACFPEVHLAAESAESDLSYTREKVDAGARFLITPAVLRQPALLRLRGPRARRRHRRPDHPGHHADHQRRADPALHADVRRRRSRPACCASSSCAPTSPTRSPTSASPTRRCSAPTCWPTARPASTSTRSTARPRRARSSPPCAASRPGGARSPLSDLPLPFRGAAERHREAGLAAAGVGGGDPRAERLGAGGEAR